MIRTHVYSRQSDALPGADVRRVVDRIVMSGHAEQARHGRDIVCAAASMLLTNFVNSAEVLCDAPLAADESDGYVSVVVIHRDDVQLLAHSAIYGMEELSRTYPRNVKVEWHTTSEEEL